MKNNIKTKILEAKWTLLPDLLYKPTVDISSLTRDEQADLIVERLTNGAPKDSLEEAISYTMSKLIADEIDKEILQSLIKGTK